MQPLKVKALSKQNVEKPFVSTLFLLLTIIVLSLCYATSFAADSTAGNTDTTQPSAYTWTDQQGVVHFGDQPVDPTSQKYNINTPAPATATQTSPPSSIQETAAQKSSGNPVDDKGASKSALEQQQQQIADNCKKAEDNIALLENNTKRIYVNDPNGQPHYLTDEERNAQMDLAQKQKTAYCDDSTTASSNK